MILQHSSFCSVAPSQISAVFNQSRNQINLLQQEFPLRRRSRRTKASTFQIACHGGELLDDLAQLAHNKVAIHDVWYNYKLWSLVINSGFLIIFIFLGPNSRFSVLYFSWHILVGFEFWVSFMLAFINLTSYLVFKLYILIRIFL